MPSFSSPPNPKEFNQQVWQLARQIPYGKVIAYGQLGALLPIPEGLILKDYDAFKGRWVGGAMAACPDDVPWWRVINAQGKISERPSAPEQRARLEAEGVVFDNKDRVDFSRFGWQGPDAPEQISLF